MSNNRFEFDLESNTVPSEEPNEYEGLGLRAEADSLDFDEDDTQRVASPVGFELSQPSPSFFEPQANQSGSSKLPPRETSGEPLPQEPYRRVTPMNESPLIVGDSNDTLIDEPVINNVTGEPLQHGAPEKSSKVFLIVLSVLGMVAIAIMLMALSVIGFFGSSAVLAESLEKGDCTSSFSPGGNGTYEVSSCRADHAMEVFWVNSEWPESAKYPSESTVALAANEKCVAEFEPFVGKSYAESELGLWTLQPSEETWKLGDRTIVCLTGAADQTTLTSGGLINSQR